MLKNHSTKSKSLLLTVKLILKFVKCRHIHFVPFHNHKSTFMILVSYADAKIKHVEWDSDTSQSDFIRNVGSVIGYMNLLLQHLARALMAMVGLVPKTAITIVLGLRTVNTFTKVS